MSTLTKEQQELIEFRRKQAIEKKNQLTCNLQSNTSIVYTNPNHNPSTNLNNVKNSEIIQSIDTKNQLTYIPQSNPIHDNEILYCNECQIHKSFDKTALLFHEMICYDCKLQSNNQYDVLTAKQIQLEYLLPMDSIQLLPFIIKPNPRNSQWNSMKLYLRKHVEQKAIQRYGSLEEISKEIELRKKKKYEKNKQENEESDLMNIFSMDLPKTSPDKESIDMIQTNRKESSTNKREKKRLKSFHGLIASIQGHNDTNP